MSLKKQVKQLKSDIQKRDEELTHLTKQSKVTRLKELEYEIEVYREELIRMRSIMPTQTAELNGF